MSLNAVLTGPGLNLRPLGEAGLQALHIENAYCTAVISLQGAQLLAYQQRGRPPLLWCSEQARYQPGKAIRGGIPLCFPWFGAHPVDASLPAHGFARTQDWRLVAADIKDEGHELVFELASSAASHALWPHDFVARLSICLGPRLELQFALRNSGAQPLVYELALHSYFAVRDVAQTRVRGLEGVPFLDQLRPERPAQREAQPLRLCAETDRVYQGAPASLWLEDEGAARRIEIGGASGGSVIVWNPWQEKTARLGDMAAEGWRQMLCVESGRVGEAAVVLAPGAQSKFSLSLSDSPAGGA